MSRRSEVDVHPSLDAWIERAENRVAGAARRRLDRHLETCDECRTREGEVRRVLEALTSDQLLEPSDVALATALRALRPAAGTAPARRPGLQDRLARLVFDSLARPDAAFAGARSAGVARRLRFEADGDELDILVESRGDSRRLTGQLLALQRTAVPRPSVHFRVAAAGHVEAEGNTDRHGEFVCELHGPGEIEIRIDWGGRVVFFRVPEAHADADG